MKGRKKPVEPAIPVCSMSAEEMKLRAGWNYTVYYHEFPDGKMYVGQTCKPLNERWGKNGNGYKSNAPMYDEILRCGWDNIKHVIYKTGLNALQALKEEDRLIKEFGTTDPVRGFNRMGGTPDARPYYKNIFIFGGCWFDRQALSVKEFTDGVHDADNAVKWIFAEWLSSIRCTPSAYQGQEKMFDDFGFDRFIRNGVIYIDRFVKHLEDVSITYRVTTIDGIKNIDLLSVVNTKKTRNRDADGLKRYMIEKRDDVFCAALDKWLVFRSREGMKMKVFIHCIMVSERSVCGSDNDGNSFWLTDAIDSLLNSGCDMSEGCIRQHIKNLSKGGFVIKDTVRGRYYINPEFGIKGTISEAKYRELVRKANEQRIKPNDKFEKNNDE